MGQISPKVTKLQHFATSKTIDDLPEEVVLMIFKLLDHESLDELGMAYEKWHDIALFGLPWTVQADGLYDDLSFLLPSIKTIEMTDGAAFKDDEDREEEIIKSSQLKRVKRVLLKLYNTETLQFFSEAQLEKITVIGGPVVPGILNRFIHRADNSHFLNFLAGQKNLTTLELASADYIFKTPIAPENVPFKLKELSISRAECYFENVLAFMTLHDDSLEILQLGQHFTTEIFEFIFAKLKKLKKLCLIIDDDDTEGRFDNLEINPSITTLKLFEHDWTCAVYKAVSFISKMPNLETLVLPFDEPYHHLKASLDYLKNLKHLTIRTFDQKFWNKFALPKLESLKFLDGELGHGSDIAIVAKNTNLKALAFDGNVDNDFMDAISKNFAKLKWLDLRKSTVNADVINHFGGTRLREENFFYDVYGQFFRHIDYNPGFSYACEPPEDYYSYDD